MSAETVVKIPGYRIPGYQIEREIGRGGMATVYLALQESLHRKVALKVMNPALSADENFRLRFLNEGHIVGQLNHSAIITIFDIGSHENHYYLSMEYLSGGSLHERIREGLPPERALAIARTLGNALGYAHQRGFIHRDIKPLNVLFREDGSPVLTDFGIAKALDASTHLTRTGFAFGSVGYMSPEQALGKPSDHRTDIYSFGVMFWEMLTGRKLYEADDPFSLALKHATAPLPTLPNELAALQPILDKLLTKQPEDRYERMENFVADLEPFQQAAASTGLHTIQTEAPTVVRPTGTTAARATGVNSSASSGDAPRSRSGVWIGLAALLLLGGAGTGFWLLGPGQNPPSTGNIPGSQTGNEPTTPPVDAAVSDEDRIARLLTRADLQWSAGRFTEPPGDNAFETYRQILELAPDNAQAQSRLVKIGRMQLAMQYQQQARQLLEKGDPDSSLKAIEQGLRLLPDNSDLQQLKSQVEARIIASETRSDGQPAGQSDAAGQTAAVSVEQLLERARQQQAAGRYLEPQGDNAFETYQQILAREPDNNAARTGLLDIGRMRLGNQYQAKAEQLLADGALQDSLDEIDRGLRLAPEHAGLKALRQQVQNRLDGGGG